MNPFLNENKKVDILYTNGDVPVHKTITPKMIVWSSTNSVQEPEWMLNAHVEGDDSFILIPLKDVVDWCQHVSK